MAPRMKRAQVQDGSSTSQTVISPAFLHREIHTGRSVDFKFFMDEGFTFPQKLDCQGWKHLFQGDGLYYPLLIREFYQNIYFGDSEVFSSVKGHKIDLSVNSIGQALKIPTDGLCHLDIEDRSAAVNTLLGAENSSGYERILAKDVSMDTRLLHHFVANAIIPKIGRFDLFNETEVSLVYCLLEEVPICLPHLMLNEMRKCERKGKGFLPYGSLLTYLFKNAGISLKGIFAKSIQGVHVYNIHTLHRMGIYKDDGQWTKKKDYIVQSGTVTQEENQLDARASPDPHVSTPRSPQVTASVTASVPSVEANEQFVKLLTDSILQRLQSEGWIKAQHTVASPHSHQDAQFSDHLESVQVTLSSLNERMSTVSAQIENLTLHQNQMEERITKIGNEYEGISSSLQAALPHLQVGTSEKLYSDMKDEACKLRASMTVSRQFMENMANAAQGLSQHLHTVCTKLEENILASLDRLQNLEVLIRQVHTSQTGLVRTLADLVDPPVANSPRAPSPIHINPSPEHHQIPDDPPIPEPPPTHKDHHTSEHQRSPSPAPSIPKASSSMPQKRKRAVRKKAKRSRPYQKYDYGVSDGSPSDENFSDAFG